MLLGFGALFVAVSALMSLLLALEHLGGLSLPGCGEGSPCARAAESVWGRINLGGFVWPVSYLGSAYFFAALATWLVTGGAVPRAFRYLVRLGAITSLGYCAVILAEWMVCPYCIVAHLGNFAFWIIVEIATVQPTPPRRTAIVLGSAFAVATLTLALGDAQHRAAVRAKAEEQRTLAAQQMIDRSKDGAPPLAASLPTSGAESRSLAQLLPPDLDEPIFTGRYRVGPEEAAIRIVMFTDYQCEDCYRIEQQLVQLHGTRTDMSISIKHFPFNSECNPELKGTMHANACWAARAAETAGLLWGPVGFWNMHVWLFDHKGAFDTTEQLQAGIRDMGYDPAGFVEAMSSDDTLQPIRDDAAEAKRLGLHFTPMIFINGVELKGWVAPNALIRTVEQVAAANPPARSAAFDRPPPAFEKYIADWRDQKTLKLPADQQPWTLGPDDARVKVVLWGDYQEAGSTQADAIIRNFAAGRNDVQYTYRHYPFNSDCNPQLKERRFPNSCRAARAAEAAGKLGGADAYWKMHAWLMDNREKFSDAALRTAAAQAGLDVDALMAALDHPDVQANILDDTQAGKQLPRLRHGMPAGIHGVPTIFVNNKYVPRWRLESRPVLKEILLEAAKP